MEEHGHPEQTGQHGETIHLPAPTAWPIVLAFGVTLVVAGIVTSPVISVLGGVLVLLASVGWFRKVLPHEAHEDVPVSAHEITITSTRTHVVHVEISEEHRAHLPLQTYPVLSGIKGGIAGGIAMIFPALIYGLIAEHSIWYPVNLLGGAGTGNWINPTTADIAAFHWQSFIIACIIQAVSSVLVGLLYGALLPMLPRRPHPAIIAGFIAPLLWTGLLHSTLGVVNPVLDARISWAWFVVSQVTFGLVAGYVVARQSKIFTTQSMPFAVRMGVEASGLSHHHDTEDRH